MSRNRRERRLYVSLQDESSNDSRTISQSGLVSFRESRRFKRNRDPGGTGRKCSAVSEEFVGRSVNRESRGGRFVVRGSLRWISVARNSRSEKQGWILNSGCRY